MSNAREIHGKNFICIHNPSCLQEWNEAYNRFSKLITPELKEELEYTKCQNESFWMLDDDFFQLFQQI